MVCLAETHAGLCEKSPSSQRCRNFGAAAGLFSPAQAGLTQTVGGGPGGLSRVRAGDARAGTTFHAPDGKASDLPTYVNEFWTAKQRQASSLHEISYRACFKPQLPRFFIERLTQPGDRVYDPFMGRGTTPLEAALLGRVPLGNDANPLSIVMTAPRLRPPALEQVEARLREVSLDDPADMPEDLLAFYHPDTLRAISSLKHYLLARRKAGAFDAMDEWLAMVALNRLTGHSNGFFSVYTLPPNQAVSAKSQRKINERRKQVPARRDVVKLILKKTRQLLGDVDRAARDTLATVAGEALLLTGPADATPQIPDGFRSPRGYFAAVPQRGAVCRGQLAALLVSGHRRPASEAYCSPQAAGLAGGDDGGFP